MLTADTQTLSSNFRSSLRPHQPMSLLLPAYGGKDVKLFISCMYNDEKGKDQCAKVSKEFGIPDAVFFNKKEKEMNEEGFPVSVDAFIARLRCRLSSSFWPSMRC